MPTKTTVRLERMPGGSGWADSMFRASVDSIGYAKSIFHRVIQKRGVEEKYDFYCSEDIFIIVCGDKVLFKKDATFVECHRAIAVYAFDDWIGKLIDKNEKILEKAKAEVVYKCAECKAILKSESII